MVASKEAPEFLGVYSSKEAALYIKATLTRTPKFPRLNTHHLSWWARKGLGEPSSIGAESEPRFFNFLELISFRMVATMRAHGILSHDIQLAHRLLQQRWGWNYPFAMEPIWICSPDVFVEIQGVPVAVTKFWQSALELIRDFLTPIENDFHGLTFDIEQQATTWTPSNGVLLNPKIQFGEPCIKGTRVPTETIWAFYQAGDSIDTLSRMYGLPKSKIESAITWEEKIAKSASAS